MYVASTKVEPSHPKKKLLLLAGTCGILDVIVSLVFISLAISYSPSFSLTQNWLSDLAGLSHASFLNVSRPVVNSPTTEILIRSQFMIGGILAIIFSIGLFYDGDAPSHRVGAVFGVLGAGAFSAAGIFPEPIAVPHLVAAYAVYLLIPTAMLLIGGALVDAPHKRLGGLSIALGILAFAGTSFISYGRGVAQLVLTLAIVVWTVIFSVRMVWHASHQVEPT
jgi:hypothetical membrane protein